MSISARKSGERIDRRDLLKAAALAPMLATIACATDAKPLATSSGKPAGSKRKPRNLPVILSDDPSKRDVGVYGQGEEFFQKHNDGELTPDDLRVLELPRHAPHAHRLVFRTPVNGERIEVISPLAADLTASIAER